ncbi:MAG: hypothetical protein WCE61_14325 [Candidatus Acidiferrum sp.]
MRKWGILVSAFYAFVVVILLVPTAAFLVSGTAILPELFEDLRKLSEQWVFWLSIVVVLSGQALLLFLSVDTSQKRLKPRAHILVSCTITAMLLALLSTAAVLSLGSAIYSDNFGSKYFDTAAQVVGFWLFLWLLWAIIFYWYARNSTHIVTQAVSWLLKGSVLELLIAVPCHIIVRRRQDCSAPILTSFGITTGIAIMLLAFGPSVLLLYKKRLDSYPPRSSA